MPLCLSVPRCCQSRMLRLRLQPAELASPPNCSPPALLLPPPPALPQLQLPLRTALRNCSCPCTHAKPSGLTCMVLLKFHLFCHTSCWDRAYAFSWPHRERSLRTAGTTKGGGAAMQPARGGQAGCGGARHAGTTAPSCCTPGAARLLAACAPGRGLSDCSAPALARSPTGWQAAALPCPAHHPHVPSLTVVELFACRQDVRVPENLLQPPPVDDVAVQAPPGQGASEGGRGGQPRAVLTRVAQQYYVPPVCQQTDGREHGARGMVSQRNPDSVDVAPGGARAHGQAPSPCAPRRSRACLPAPFQRPRPVVRKAPPALTNLIHPPSLTLHPVEGCTRQLALSPPGKGWAADSAASRCGATSTSSSNIIVACGGAARQNAGAVTGCCWNPAAPRPAPAATPAEGPRATEQLQPAGTQSPSHPTSAPLRSAVSCSSR